MAIQATFLGTTFQEVEAVGSLGRDPISVLPALSHVANHSNIELSVSPLILLVYATAEENTWSTDIREAKPGERSSS